MKKMRIVLLLAGFGCLLPAAAQAEEKRFEPEKCFPLECLAYLKVPSGKGLLGVLSDTVAGRIARDPEVRSALGQLPEVGYEAMRSMAAPVIEATGRDPLELLKLLENGFTLSVTGLDPAAKVSVAAALELGQNREAVLEVVQKLSGYLAEMRGGQLPSAEIGARKVTVWPVLGGLSSVHSLVLGTHLVFATSLDVLKSIAEAYDAGDGGDFSLAANPRYKEARQGLALERQELLFFLNIESLRGLVMTFLTLAPQSKELVKGLRSSGLLSITCLGYSLGGRDGGLEGKLLLGTGDGASGLLGDLLASTAPPRDLLAPLALVPAGARTVGAASCDGGKLFHALRRFIDEGLPEGLRAHVNEVIQRLEEKSGISLEKDLFTLKRIDLHTFTIDPPAGSLFSDSLTLARTEEVEPYRAVLLKAAKALGNEPRELPGPSGGSTGPSIHLLRAGSVFTRLLGMEPPPPPEGLGLALLDPPISLAWVELEGGWTLLSWAPQPIWRYLSARSSMKPMSGVEAVAARLKSDSSGAQGFWVLRPGRSILPVYNSLATILEAVGNGPLEEYLKAYSVNLSRLPPGEKFLGSLKDGFLRLELGPRGLVVHGHRLLDNSSIGSEWVPVAAGAGVVAAIVMPVIVKARGQADAVKCQSNLREIQKLAFLYADSAGNRFLPHSPGGGVAALQVLVDFHRGLDPGIFVCPRSEQEPPSREGEKLKIDPSHSSYEMVSWKLSPSDPPYCILAFDRSPCHGGKRNVVYLDSSVDSLSEGEFQSKLSEQRERFGGDSGGAAPKPKKRAKRSQKSTEKPAEKSAEKPAEKE
jgi:hypothetical protein